MATHSSILAWEIPWTEEPVRLQSMELQRVGPDTATKQQQQQQLFSASFLHKDGERYRKEYYPFLENLCTHHTRLPMSCVLPHAVPLSRPHPPARGNYPQDFAHTVQSIFCPLGFQFLL